LILIPESITANFTTDDQIGAFDIEDNCFGSVAYNGENVLTLSVFGNDPSTAEKDGFEQGDLIIFRFFSSQTGEEFLAKVDFDKNMPNPDPYFESFGISAIQELKLETNSASAVNQTPSLHIYPNPAEESVIVAISGAESFKNMEIVIYSISGAELKRIDINKSKTVISIADLPAGIYNCMVVSASYSPIYKKIIKM